MIANVLVLGSSMTNSWKKMEDNFYKNLGISPIFLAWHGEAWRYEINSCPYKLEGDKIQFSNVKNNSNFFQNIESYSVYGTPLSFNLNDLDGLFFTQPTVERHFLFSLFKNKNYVFSETLFSKLTTSEITDHLVTPISKAVFYHWWRSHQFYANSFLQLMFDKFPRVKIFITPEITGRKDQGYDKLFNIFYLSMMEILNSYLKEKFNIEYCLQPQSSLDFDVHFTKDEFAFPSPDPHHYSEKYVDLISQTKEFNSFLSGII